MMEALSDEGVVAARNDMRKAVKESEARSCDLSALRQIHLETALFEASYLEKKVCKNICTS